MLGLLRYPLSDSSDTQDRLLEMWAYEARRLFRDRLVGEKALDQFDAILNSILRFDWSADSSSLDQEGGAFYVTWGSHHSSLSDDIGTQFGRSLGRLSAVDMQEMVTKAVIAYGRCWMNSRLKTWIPGCEATCFFSISDGKCHNHFHRDVSFTDAHYSLVPRPAVFQYPCPLT